MCFDSLFAAATLLAFIAAQSGAVAEYEFINIVDTSTAAPVGNFDVFTTHWPPPAISGGNVAFYGRYANRSGTGIFTGNGESITTIALSGDTSPIGILGDFTPPTISGDTVAFGAYVNARVAHFSGKGGSVSTIAVPGAPSPHGTFGFPIGASPAVSDDTFAFLSGGPKQAIYSSTDSALKTIALTDEPLPSGRLVDMYPDVAVSGKNVVFMGRDEQFEPAIFMGDGDTLTPIAKRGDAVPGGVILLLGTFSPAISGSTVAFQSPTGVSTLIAQGQAVFTGSGGVLTSVVRSGDPAPVGKFIAFADPAISGDTVAFLGVYGEASVYHGIFTSRAGVHRQVIARGDSLFGSTVEDVAIGRFGLDPNGSGDIAFWYFLSDGRTGIAMANPVPEPSLAIMLLGTLFLSCTSRRVAKTM